MNIGIDIRCLMHRTKTGVGEYTQALLDAIFLIDKTNQYYLYYNSQKNITNNLPKWDQDNVHTISSHYPNKLFNIFIALTGFPKLDRLITKITHAKLDAFYSPNLNFTALTKEIPFFLTIHDLAFHHFQESYTIKQNLWHKLLKPRKQCERAKIIFTPSKNTKLDLIHTFQLPPEKILTIYPGLSPIFLLHLDLDIKKTIVQKKYGLPNHFILYLGTIEPRKNIDGLITAFEKIFSQLPFPHYLIIAGTKGWKNEKIYQRANQSPCRDHIKFIGYIEAEEKPALYALADLFIYPSFYEGFGFPVLEAMAMGTPVITSQRSSLPEITKNCARLIDPNNTYSIGYGIRDILSNLTKTKKQTDEAKLRSQFFSGEKSAQEFLKTIIHYYSSRS
ncbi:MAG: glycosyltransferase family 1 protein [bacterium]|nr:glycosyltransferase family 1 protein [bacterium]